MFSKQFTSPLGWFSLSLPNAWNEYDDGEEGTCAFFNSESWTGNLRITSIRWEGNEDVSVFLRNRLAETPGASQIHLRNKNCIFYREKSDKSEEGNIIYWWLTGRGNTILVCSFTINIDIELDKRRESELNVVEEIIGSIKF